MKFRFFRIAAIFSFFALIGAAQANDLGENAEQTNLSNRWEFHLDGVEPRELLGMIARLGKFEYVIGDELSATPMDVDESVVNLREFFDRVIKKNGLETRSMGLSSTSQILLVASECRLAHTEWLPIDPVGEMAFGMDIRGTSPFFVNLLRDSENYQVDVSKVSASGDISLRFGKLPARRALEAVAIVQGWKLVPRASPRFWSVIPNSELASCKDTQLKPQPSELAQTAKNSKSCNIFFHFDGCSDPTFEDILHLKPIGYIRRAGKSDAELQAVLPRFDTLLNANEQIGITDWRIARVTSRGVELVSSKLSKDFPKDWKSDQPMLPYPRTLAWAPRAAAHGDASALKVLGDMANFGIGVPQSDLRASKWYLKAAKKNDTDAQIELGNLYGKGLGVPKNISEAEKWWLTAGSLGSLRAQYRLCEGYSGKGDILQRDAKLASAWCERASESGEGRAQLLFALLLENGDLINPDLPKAAFWMRKAAEAGHAVAQFHLGSMYARGAGVSQSFRDAQEWYTKSAENGHIQAQVSLGALYFSERNGPRDLKQAAQWWTRAAQRGSVDAQSLLCRNFDEMKGIANIDPSTNVKWCRSAAEYGDAINQLWLAVMLQAGLNIKQDKVEAMQWYQKAADRGNLDAQYVIGMAYYHGEGVTKDDREASRYLLQASQNGNEKAQLALCSLHSETTHSPVRDPKLSVEWCQKSAMAGNPYGQTMFAAMLENGGDLAQNKAEAAKWFRKASDQGETYAQYRLGMLYAAGVGVELDYAQAMRLWKKAADHGSTEAAKALAQWQGKQETPGQTRVEGSKIDEIKNWLPLKAGLWKMRIVYSTRRGIDESLGWTKSESTQTVCVTQSENRAAQAPWPNPSGNEKIDATQGDDVKILVNTDKEFESVVRFQLFGPSEIHYKGQKLSDDRYSYEVKARFAGLFLEPVYVDPPSFLNTSVVAEFQGKCDH